SRRAWFVGVVTIAIVAVAALGWAPIVHSAILGAIVLVLGKALTPTEARRAIHAETLIVIAAAFGIGSALENSGVADVLGTSIVGSLQPWGEIVVLLALVIATTALTELITNNAAAVLMFPVAM